MAAGLTLGAGAALLARRWVAPFLYGLSPSDPTTWALAALTLAAAGLAAGARPAWRAASVDPLTTLREE